MLSTIGVLLTAFFTGIFIWWISGMSWSNIAFPITTSLLLAATMSSTDSASVFAILRSQNINLKHNLRPMLELESGSNDPMAYMLTIVLIQLVQASGVSGGDIALSFAVQFIVGGALGYALGRTAVFMLNRLNIDNQSLYPILLLAFVFFTFSITDLFKGNGYLAVYIAGMIVGNNKIKHRKEITTFMDGLSWLFQIIMFLCLGLLVNPHEMLDVAIVATLIGVFMIFIGRPLSVFLCLLPFKNMTTKSRIFISWVGLRGAVPIIFATYPVVAGIEGANMIFNIVFFITLLSLLMQGMSISWVARKFNLDLPIEKEGNEFGVELPEELDAQLSDYVVTESMIKNGNRLMDMHLPASTLVIMIKRGEETIVTKGDTLIYPGDNVIMSVPPYTPSEDEQLEERYISRKDPWCNKKIAELGLKEDELIALVIREDKSIIPDGKTVLLEKDVVVLYK